MGRTFQGTRIWGKMGKPSPWEMGPLSPVVGIFFFSKSAFRHSAFCLFFSLPRPQLSLGHTSPTSWERLNEVGVLAVPQWGWGKAKGRRLEPGGAESCGPS